LPIWIGYMGRALKDVPMQTPPMPNGITAFGSGRERTYIYNENVVKEAPPAEPGEEAGEQTPSALVDPAHLPPPSD